MNARLLATKFHRPVVPPERIHRSHLSQCLEDGLASGSRLTLVSAPAGFGKTTLVSTWLSQLTVHDCAWLSLDKYDDDPNRFWQYLVAALRMAVPNIGNSTCQLLPTTPLPPPPALLTDLINDLTDLPHRLVHALDDYHHISSRAIHEGLDFLLDHTSSQLHLVLTTRADPPLSLARLRARGQLNELRQADLRFNAEEASRFLTESMGLDLAARDIEMLEKRTEGWITGLQLAAISFEWLQIVSNGVPWFHGCTKGLRDPDRRSSWKQLVSLVRWSDHPSPR